jgi:hypothetical protein
MPALLLLLLAAAAAAAPQSALLSPSGDAAALTAPLAFPQPCTIPRHAGGAALSLAAFRAAYKGARPVIFTPAAPSAAAAAALSRGALLAAYGHLPVTLASANSNSYAKRASTLRGYLREHMAPVPPGAPADQLWYLFGDTLASEAWAPLHATFALPLDAARDDPVVAWGVGGLHSGVPFHRHGAVYAESVLGAKRWWLAPPGAAPAFDGNATQLSYALARQGREEDEGVLACTVAQGEAIYIPAQWWHATLNLNEYTAFTSAFVREQG